MSDVVQEASQEFWQPPVPLEVAAIVIPAPEAPILAEVCQRCKTEFLFGSRFCHTCGASRTSKAAISPAQPSLAGEFLTEALSTFQWLFRTASRRVAGSNVRLPGWLRYLHFHEIQRWIGLPTASLISFFIGMGCVAGAIGVSIFYRASNLAEFQAVQLWRIQWLLGATASFVAGIFLQKPSRSSDDDKNDGE